MEKTKTRNFNIFLQLTKRHLLVFFKSKMTVLYTLLVPIIVFVIYILFLKDLEMSTVKSVLSSYNIAFDGTSELGRTLTGIVDSWMLSGILAVTSVTVSIQTNYIFVRDKDQGINRDFSSSPISGGILIASYFIFNFIVTALISFIFLLIAFLYLYCNGEFVYDFVDFIAILGTLSLSVISSTLMMVFLCSFIKKESSLTSIIAIFSSAIGFLIGAYMPMGMLPSSIQWACAFLPPTHCCGLYRYVFLAKPFSNLQVLAADINGGSEIIEALSGTFGFNLNFFGAEITPGFMTLFIIAFIIIFIILNILAGNNLTKISGGEPKFKFKRKNK